MGARFYDSSLGRWTSADTIVPNPENPQSLNRYTWVLNQPLRFVDPTGHYSEDEIMQAFEVETWNEVLAMFEKGGTLEGLWGWLEILREASDDDMVMWGAFQKMGSGESLIGALPHNMGWFHRDGEGHILVGNRAHPEFAAEGRGFIYSLFRERPGGDYDLEYRTRSSDRHHHIYFERVSPDRVAARSDALDVLYDAASAVLVATGFPLTVAGGGALEALAFFKDLGPGLEGATHVGACSTGGVGYYDSGHVFDAAGAIPWLGAFPDAASCLFNFFGWRFYVTH